MNFEIYCDEALPDLFTSLRPRARYLMIGSLWLPSEMRDEAKARISAVRERHAVWGELKWTKISPLKQAFYEELVAFFRSRGRNDRAKAVAKQMAMIEAAVAAVETRIDALDIDATIRGAMTQPMTLGETSGASPEASASTHAP